jgi:peptidoglycan/xylan/chitin deacetylase (PgdA/CDA1 family)
MKIIISHDVDHLYLTEHLFDGTLLKYFARAILERMNGVLSNQEFAWRMKDLLNKQWHHIDELMDFDEANGIPSTFFFAMANGKGLNYSRAAVAPVIKRVIDRGFDVGVHGIDFHDQEFINSEFNQFRKLTGKSDFGIRMHYLKKNERTLELLNNAGYLYDSSELSEKGPYQFGNMWEFPLHIMDSNEFYQGKSIQFEKTEPIIEEEKKRIAKFAAENNQYLTLLFHDRYYCNAYESYRQWYETIIWHFLDKGHTFISYREAIAELSHKEL